MPPLAECRAIGCGERLLPWGLFCPRCWSLIPIEIRKGIERHHRPRRRPSKICEQYLERALADLLEFKTTGRHIPRDGDFEFDDDAPAAIGVQDKLTDAE